MSALDKLVSKIRRAVSGAEEAPDPSHKPFNWEPTPAPPMPARDAAPPSLELPDTPRPKRPAPEPTAVVGAAIPADVADFTTVYKAAGVQAPAHGYGVERVGGMLDHKSLAGLDRGVKASAVLAALDAAGVPLHDVVDDALLRQKALAAFEAAKELEVCGLRPRAERRVEELQAQIAAFREAKNAEVEALTRETTAAVQALGRLRSRAKAEEERFHRAVALFVEPLPARVIPMPRPEAAAEPKPVEAKTELRLVAPPAASSAPAAEPKATEEAKPAEPAKDAAAPPAAAPEKKGEA